MVIKMSNIACFMYFLLVTEKKWSQFGQSIWDFKWHEINKKQGRVLTIMAEQTTSKLLKTVMSQIYKYCKQRKCRQYCEVDIIIGVTEDHTP